MNKIFRIGSRAIIFKSSGTGPSEGMRVEEIDEKEAVKLLKEDLLLQDEADKLKRMMSGRL